MKEPEDPTIVVRDIFRQYINAKREFGATAERCLLKGWPDRKAAIQNTSRLGHLVSEIELLRFEYLVSTVPVDDKVLKSFAHIFDRLYKDWGNGEEVALRARNSTYRDVSMELEAEKASKAALGPIALDGPFAGAKRDPEYLNAVAALDMKHRELDEQLGKLAALMPKTGKAITVPGKL